MRVPTASEVHDHFKAILSGLDQPNLTPTAKCKLLAEAIREAGAVRKSLAALTATDLAPYLNELTSRVIAALEATLVDGDAEQAQLPFDVEPPKAAVDALMKVQSAETPTNIPADPQHDSIAAAVALGKAVALPLVVASAKAPVTQSEPTPAKALGYWTGFECKSCKRKFDFCPSKCECGNGSFAAVDYEWLCQRCDARFYFLRCRFPECPECGTRDDKIVIPAKRSLPPPQFLLPCPEGAKDHRDGATLGWYPYCHHEFKSGYWSEAFKKNCEWHCVNCKTRSSVKFKECPACGQSDYSERKLVVKLHPPLDLIPRLEEIILPDRNDYFALPEIVARAESLLPLNVWTLGQFLCDRKDPCFTSPDPCKSENIILKIPGVDFTKAKDTDEILSEYQCVDCGHRDKIQMPWAEWRKLRETEPIAVGFELGFTESSTWRLRNPDREAFCEKHLAKKIYSLPELWREVAKQFAPTAERPDAKAVAVGVAGFNPSAAPAARPKKGRPPKAKPAPEAAAVDAATHSANQELAHDLQSALDASEAPKGSETAPEVQNLATAQLITPEIPPAPKPRTPSLSGGPGGAAGVPKGFQGQPQAAPQAQRAAPAQTDQPVGLPKVPSAVQAVPQIRLDAKAEAAIQKATEDPPAAFDLAAMDRELRGMLSGWPLEKLVKEYEAMTGAKYTQGVTLPDAMSEAIVKALLAVGGAV